MHALRTHAGMAELVAEELTTALLYYSQHCTAQEHPGAGNLEINREQRVQPKKCRRPRNRHDKDSCREQENDVAEETSSKHTGRLRAPKTHLTAEIARRRKDPAPSDKSRVFSALAALQAGDAAKVDELIEADDADVPEEWQSRYRNEARRYWDHFYREKNVNFFKDRNYLREEFTEIMPQEVVSDPKAWVDTLQSVDMSPPASGQEVAARLEGQTVLLEIGCAVGNGVIPILRANPGIFAIACDISPVAVSLLRQKEEYQCGRCFAFSCDVSREEQPSSDHSSLLDIVPKSSVDFVTMLFVLSAIDPTRHRYVLSLLRSILKPGGCILFRDYGLHDLSQLRFPVGHRLGENTYVRADGTLSVFFEVESLKALFAECGFECIDCQYQRREIVNRATEIVMPRVWVQGKFRCCD